MNATATLHCQGCGSRQIRRTHRIGLKDKLQSLFGRYPYHCHNCPVRSMLPSQAQPAAAAPTRQLRKERQMSESRRQYRLVLLFAICAVLFTVFMKLFILRVPSGE